MVMINRLYMSHFCHVLTINHLSLTIAGKAR